MENNDSHETKRESSSPDSGVEFAARRRVLKGLVSVPVAVTLSNGAALAAVSSHQCLTNELEAPPVCTTPSAPDEDHAWSWELVDTQVQGCGHVNSCVPYAVETVPGSYDITGFRACAKNNGDVFIDQDGEVIGGPPEGNPLRASCAASFL